MSRASRLLLVASFACLITLVITRPAFATGGTIETPTSSTVSQPIVISGWAVAFRCPTAPPGPGYECTADGSWYPPGHAFYTAAGTFVGCTGTPPSSPPQVCFWYSPWIAASSSLAIQQAGNPADGTGVDVVEIWTCPGTTCTSSNKVLQGTATYGQPRSDVATLLGSSRFTNSGYSFTLSTLTPGQYVVRVRMHSAIYDNWNTTSKTITVVAATTHPVMGLDALVSNGASVSQPFPFSGWAFDTAAPSGTGVDTVAVNAWHNPGSGQPAFNWAPITLGGSRPAVGSTYGSQFTNSGYTTTVTGYPAGVYYPVAFMRSTLTSMWTLTTSTLYVDATTFALTIDRQGSGTGGVSASGLSCAGGASTQALPCGATYPVNTVVTLTPQADTGSTFLGWAGACSGTGACQLTLSTARLAAAIFSKTPTSSDVSYYHTDAIGSVRAITDAAGATVIRHDYGAFGEDTQPLTGDPQRFGGMQLDPESALNYAGARYYRVSWGRFTQVDPLGGSLTNPQRWNGYAYALNNPLRYVDPLGMSYHVCTWGDFGAGCGDVDWDDDFWRDLSASSSYYTRADGNYWHGSIYCGENLSLCGIWDWYCGVDCSRGPTTGTSPDAPPDGGDPGGGGPDGGGPDAGSGPGAWGRGFPRAPVPPVTAVPPVTPSAGPADGKSERTSANTNGTASPVHGLWTYGNFCGLGGVGTPKDALDSACQAHDVCYDDAGFDAYSNRSSGNAALQKCNQKLCDAAIASAMDDPWAFSPAQQSRARAAAEILLFFRFVPRKANQCYLP